MKKILVLLFLFFSLTMIFGNECEQKQEIEKPILKEKHLDYPDFYLPRFASAIVGGASLLSMMLVPPIPGIFLLTNPVYIFEYNAGFMLGIMTIAILELPLLVIGSIVLGYGNKKFMALYDRVDIEKKRKFLNKSVKRYTYMSITTAGLSGTFFTMLSSGIAFSVIGLTNKEYSTLGICLDVFGGIGFGICLSLMISSLAIFGWCKKQLSTVTPELSFTHDNKKDYSEGYSLKMGLKVRI